MYFFVLSRILQTQYLYLNMVGSSRNNSMAEYTESICRIVESIRLYISVSQTTNYSLCLTIFCKLLIIQNLSQGQELIMKNIKNKYLWYSCSLMLLNNLVISQGIHLMSLLKTMLGK